MFFEGPEKKVELALAPGRPSLRSRGHEYWKGIVAKANAQVLSTISNESMDAYLLSESSLFVTDTWLTMITCGRTDLVAAVIQLVDDFGTDGFQYLVYERKNAHHQEYQPSNFFDDCRRLTDRMPAKSYRFGDGDDHHVFLFHLDKPYTPAAEDLTLEILMHGIDPQASRVFMSGPSRKKDFIRDKSGVWSILSGFQVDDYLFEPMGYSLNAIRGSKYYTIHVTPQKIGSYVSFETNAVEGDANETITRVLDLFKPQSCDVVLFQPQSSRQKIRCYYPIKRAVRQNLSCGYRVTFDHHFKPVEGAAPAVEIVL
ncbi:MAG: adenosylmethionine decarboxylase [Elusimicrobiota bacterium]|nr:adenosylmethionine decarboxylase [Elusimicrobiota bacterium]